MSEASFRFCAADASFHAAIVSFAFKAQLEPAPKTAASATIKTWLARDTFTSIDCLRQTIGLPRPPFVPDATDCVSKQRDIVKPRSVGTLQTPDGRYIVVRGRLWRCANPSLSEEDRSSLTRELMDARRSIAKIKRAGGADDEFATARAAVDRAKVALGERGPVWWTDGAPDLTRRLARNTPYAEWYERLDRN